jgi:hypothetical protein
VAIAVMNAAGVLWLASDGKADVVTLLHEAFDTLDHAVLESRGLA